MPKEGDRKTSKGLLKARDKTEDIMATLANIDAESDMVATEVRRSRGLAAAMKKQLFRLDEVIQHEAQGRTAPQMSLEEVLQGAFVNMPGLRDDERAAIRAAAKRGEEMPDDPDEEEEEDGEEDGGRPPRPSRSPSADNAEVFFAAPAVVAEALAAAGRPIPETFISIWPGDARSSALAWARKKQEGGDPPQPPVLQKRYLEDLDLSAPGEGRRELAGWMRLPLALGDDEEAWAILGEWMVTAHRRDRGERGVHMVELPDIMLPSVELLAEVKQSICTFHGNRLQVVERFLPQGLLAAARVGFSIDTLLAASELTLGDDGELVTGRPDLVDPPERLMIRARHVLDRGGNLPQQGEGGEAEGEESAAAPEEEPRVSYREARIADLRVPFVDDEEGVLPVVLRFSGEKRLPEQITGVALLEVGGTYEGVRDNSALTYLEDPVILARVAESYGSLMSWEEAQAAGQEEPDVEEEGLDQEPAEVVEEPTAEEREQLDEETVAEEAPPPVPGPNPWAGTEGAEAWEGQGEEEVEPQPVEPTPITRPRRRRGAI